MLANLLSKSGLFTEFCIQVLKRRVKKSREYWYIGSINDKSEMQKKSSEVLNATGL